MIQRNRQFMKYPIIVVILVAIFNCKASSQVKIAAKDAPKHIGEKVMICDKVYSTKLIQGSNLTLLFLGGDFPDQLLTATIKVADKNKFKDHPAVYYRGRNVCVTGKLTEYKGKPGIVVQNQSQLKLDLIDNTIRKPIKP